MWVNKIIDSKEKMIGERVEKIGEFTFVAKREIRFSLKLKIERNECTCLLKVAASEHGLDEHERGFRI